MTTCAARLVRAIPAGSELAGMGLYGCVYASVYEFSEVFGAAHTHDPGGAHWQHQWYFETPRGRAIVRDWHLSPGGLLSVIATDQRAALWLASYLRVLGLRARANL